MRTTLAPSAFFLLDGRPFVGPVFFEQAELVVAIVVEAPGDEVVGEALAIGGDGDVWLRGGFECSGRLRRGEGASEKENRQRFR